MTSPLTLDGGAHDYVTDVLPSAPVLNGKLVKGALALAAVGFLAVGGWSVSNSTRLYTSVGLPVAQVSAPTIAKLTHGASVRARTPVQSGMGFASDRPLTPSAADTGIAHLTDRAPVPPQGPSKVEAVADALWEGPGEGTPTLSGIGAMMAGLMMFLRLIHERKGVPEELTSLTSQGERWCMASVADAGDKDKDLDEPKPKRPWFLSIDLVLLTYLAVWYFGNYKSNISNKLALAEMGGASGTPLLVGVAEMFVGVVYALFLWAAPDARKLPKITLSDLKAMIPLTICTLGHQFCTVYATSAGSLSSVQILKALEPAFAAVFATFVYGKHFSKAKWLCLIPIIGGVCLASIKDVSFSWVACTAVLLSNVFSAFRSNENRKAMETPGLKERLGSVGNQFATTSCLCFLAGLPLALISEGHMLPVFIAQLTSNSMVQYHIISAGLWFYIYNEVSTLVVKRTGALTQSVLNTAKRVIVIVGASIVLGEGLGGLKLIGCGIGIGGVFLYSIIDKVLPPKPKPAVQG